MDKTIDCRTLQCPEPVLKIKACVEKHPVTRVSVIVDNDAAVENVSRFLNYQGFEVAVDSDGISSTVSGTRDIEVSGLTATKPFKDLPDPAEHRKILVMISSDRIGKGDDELGGKLMASFIKTLPEMGPDLWRLVFVNHGVKLATESSGVLEALKSLESSGVDILVCGACLTHLGLMDEKKAGQTTNMLDIVTSMQLADNVINL